MKKLVLIDGNAILHRAYHALPPLTNDKGEPTNAVHGFFSMLLSVIDSQTPDYLIVCFDRAKPTFRQALFVGYQQQRPSLAEDFKPQIVTVHKILESLNVPIFEVDGYEADDMIGTLSVAAKKEDIETVIVSGDRDLLQLVNANVKVLMPVVGISKSVLMGASEVEEKYGIKPSQVVDYKALVGDASDGYPGVSGIGPKTASSLLRKYDNFDNLYKNLGELPQKISEKLATDAEQASLARKLAGIVTDAPAKIDLEISKTPSLTKFGEVLQEAGLRTLSARAYKFAQPGIQTQEVVIPNKNSEEPKEDKQLDLL
jgi:DNA polymerase I